MADEITFETLTEDCTATLGCTQGQAHELLTTLCANWQRTRDELPAIVVALTASGMSRSQALAWLALTPGLGELPIGRELVFFAAVRIAQRCGMAPALLEQLQAEAAHARERGDLH